MTIFETAIFYIIIAICCIFISNLANKKNKRSLVYLIIIILSIIGGCRHYSVGIDTKPYMLGIEYFYKTGKIAWNCSFALGYGYFIKFVYDIYHNYNFLLFIQALIINSLIILRFWDFRKKSSFPFMMFLYLIVIYLRTFNLNVQYIALAIVFYSTRFLENKKNVLYISIVLLASTIHTSALIGLLYYFIEWMDFKKITKNGLIIKMITAIIGGGLLIYATTMLSERYSKYLTGRESAIGLMVFAQLAVYLFSTVLYKKIKLNEGNEEVRNKMSKVNLYYIIGIVLSAASYIITNAGRISYYLMIFEPVFYGIVIKDKKINNYYKIFIIIWFIIYAIYVFINTNNATGYFPFSFFWMKS